MNSNELFNKFLYSDFSDELFCLKLKECIKLNMEDISKLENLEKLEPYQEQDLQDHKEAVEYLHKTYIYFSGDYSFDPSENESNTSQRNNQ